MKYSFYFWAEILSLIISLYSFKGIKNTSLHYFPIFLGIIVLYEYGTIQNWFTINHSNLWAANIITIFEFTFYSFFLRLLIVDKKKKKKILFAFTLLLIITVINISYIQGFWKFHSYTFLLSSIFIVFLICTFFLQVLKSNDIEFSILLYPNFWIATGLLFFYLGGFAFFSFFEFMAYKGDYTYLSLAKLILNFTNVILYSFLSIGFICQYKTLP